MSMPIVHHVRQKSQAKGSARTLLFNLALYANECCGVAWPADETLFHDVNVSRQRIHELKNALEQIGELVILERPGLTNLYFVAWQGKPVGGTPLDTRDGHDPRCPLRHPALAARCAQLWATHQVTPETSEGSEIPDPPCTGEGSEFSDPGGSEIPEGGGQKALTRKRRENDIHITGSPPARRMISHRGGASPSWPSPHRWQGKTCGRDGCDQPQCPHWQQCAEHACCEACAAMPAPA